MLSFWFFCFHPQQMFVFFSFWLTTNVWLSHVWFLFPGLLKCCHRNLFFPFGSCCYILICITFSAIYGLVLFKFFFHSFIPVLSDFLGVLIWCLKIVFVFKGWIIDASNGSSQNTLLSKVPILACQMAFIMWYSAAFQIIWKKHYAVHLPLPCVSLSTAVAQMSAWIPSSALLCILALCICLSRAPCVSSLAWLLSSRASFSSGLEEIHV